MDPPLLPAETSSSDNDATWPDNLRCPDKAEDHNTDELHQQGHKEGLRRDGLIVGEHRLLVHHLASCFVKAVVGQRCAKRPT